MLPCDSFTQKHIDPYSFVGRNTDKVVTLSKCVDEYENCARITAVSENVCDITNAAKIVGLQFITFSQL